jgi:predicted metal-dependent hydrolase
MPTVTSNDPVVVVLVVLLLLLLGGTGGGFIRGLNRDRRANRVDDAALLDQVRTLVREEVAHVSAQLKQERNRTVRLERRVDQLTETMRAHGVPVPAWPQMTVDLLDDSND